MTEIPTRMPKTAHSDIETDFGNYRQHDYTCARCGRHWQIIYDNICQAAPHYRQTRKRLPDRHAELLPELLPANPNCLPSYRYLTLNGRMIASGLSHNELNKIWRQSVAEHRCGDPLPAPAAKKRRRFLRRAR